MNFEKLAFCIQQTNELLQQNAVKAVNIHITLRNWLTGFYHTYPQIFGLITQEFKTIAT
ncbi:MAG: hypothetical protein K0R59_4092 [Sphingobacterium sp.]|jgi:hypothetical protein|nr:hypothetical protein [Sphingobacterium sp.]